MNIRRPPSRAEVFAAHAYATSTLVIAGLIGAALMGGACGLWQAIAIELKMAAWWMH
jgi:hypothetical protein